MSKRLRNFIDSLREEMSDEEIAAGLDNGEIEKPEWVFVYPKNEYQMIVEDEEDSVFHFCLPDFN
jgi:hypothetical protein